MKWVVTMEVVRQCLEGFKYWAKFEEPDDENENYKHFVQAEGKSLEEVARKIATYIDSGKMYNDGRYV